MIKIDNTLQQCYTFHTINNGGKSMTTADIIKDLLSKSDIQQKELGKFLGVSEVCISNRLRRNSISSDDFLKILDFLGYEINIVSKKTKEIETIRNKGVGKRIKMMVDGIKYDTAKADAICHSDATDFCFYELYKDDEGRYFVAQYSNWENGTNSISPIDENEAMKIRKKLTNE